MQIPKQITAGDNVEWTEKEFRNSLGVILDHPIWGIKIAFNGPTKFTIDYEHIDSEWIAKITKEISSTLKAGQYYWQVFAINDDSKTTLQVGSLEVLANLEIENTGYDGRSQNERDLDAVQKAIRALITGGAVQRYKINNREVQKMNLGDLRAYEATLIYKVNQEKRKQKIKDGSGDPLTLKVRFK